MMTDRQSCVEPGYDPDESDSDRERRRHEVSSRHWYGRSMGSVHPRLQLARARQAAEDAAAATAAAAAAAAAVAATASPVT